MLSIIFGISMVSLMGFGIASHEPEPKEAVLEVRECSLKMPVYVINGKPVEPAGQPFADCKEIEKPQEEKPDLNELRRL